MAVPHTRPAARALVAALLTSVAIACGSDVTAPSIESTTFASSLGVDLAASTRTASGLYWRDITVGTGATATAGDTATVGYALYNTNGALWETNSFSFEVGDRTGTYSAIPGFDEGVTGMRVGGRRQLIIPPDLAYGNQWAGNIPPNSILVFNVELQNLR